MLGSSSLMQLNYSFKILLVCYVTPLPALTWSSLWLLLCLRKDPFKPFAEIAFASVSRDLPSLVPAASPASPDQARIPHTAVDEMNYGRSAGMAGRQRLPPVQSTQTLCLQLAAGLWGACNKNVSAWLNTEGVSG